MLAPKSFAEFGIEEYHQYIQSLNKPKEVTSNRKAQKDFKVRVKRKKDGTISIATKRNPPYVTEAELKKISEETDIPQNDLWLRVTELKYLITPSHRDAEKIKKNLENIPF